MRHWLSMLDYNRGELADLIALARRFKAGDAAERDQILRALQASGGKRIEAARLLGLSRRTLYRKLDRYGITR